MGNKYSYDFAKDLSLNGEPLQIPNMYPVSWKEGQIFREIDDPDRMNCPWNLPKFVTEKNPHQQRKKLIVDEVDLESIGVNPYPSNEWPYFSFAKVIHNILEPEECAELLSSVNEKGSIKSIIYSRIDIQFII